MAPNSKMQSPTLPHSNAEEIPDHDYNTEMVKVDTKLDAPQQQRVPPKYPEAKAKVVQVLVKHRTRDKEDFEPQREITGDPSLKELTYNIVKSS